MCRRGFPLSGIVAVLLAVRWVGCEGKGLYEPCQMAESMYQDCKVSALQSRCEENKTDCFATCTTFDHPQCLDGPCTIVTFRDLGSDKAFVSGHAFCSTPCDVTAQDCPGDATCIPANGQGLCVPNRYLTTPTQ